MMIESIYKFYLPLLVVAGDYALRIQGRVHSFPSKDEFDNPFGQALTDADLSVQNMLEVATLAKFPELAFYGEEEARSLNMKYFPAESDLKVILDPIDGTRFYADGRPDFNIILSVIDSEWYRLVINYLPAYDCCFVAIKGEGAWELDRDEMKQGALNRRLELNSKSKLIVTYRCADLTRLFDEDFSVIDIALSYSKLETCPNANAILLKSARAFFGRKHHIIDWGAQAFIVQEAGGIASDWKGRPLPSFSKLNGPYFLGVVAAADEESHQLMLEKLKNIEF